MSFQQIVGSGRDLVALKLDPIEMLRNVLAILDGLSGAVHLAIEPVNALIQLAR
jgi:hypothetical protein